MNSSSDSSIGIFDSGFGGLTIVRAIQSLLPQENIVYFGDTAHLPYGNRKADAILRYSLESVSFLMTQKIKILVIACHTACAFALHQIQNLVPLPVFNVFSPAVEETIALSKKGCIGVLGTRATISSEIYQKEIKSRCPSMEISAISCPLFVPIIEEGFAQSKLAEIAAQEYLKPLKEKNIDTLLLACTHYPLLRTTIQKEVGKDIFLVDPAKKCAEKIYDFLVCNALMRNKQEPPQSTFYVSEDPVKFQTLGEVFLEAPIESVNMFYPQDYK